MNAFGFTALIFAALTILQGCSTPKKLMKNCEAQGSQVYECEEL